MSDRHRQRGCEEWLENEIPKLECSDKDTERTYYFRWWVYRKHLKKTPEGFVVTEFLPDVPWSGKYNVINAAAGHHIMEGRWLKNADIYFNDYIRFLLNHAHEGTQYSSFTLWATKEFHAVTGKADIPAFLPKAKALYADFEREHGRLVMWIDESGTPDTHCWWSRKVLKENGWPKDKGGFERGKDYNHSTFCDLVISALSGVEYKNGALSFDPVIPDNMEYFSIDDLCIQGNRYRIVFDHTGNKYGKMGTFVYKNGGIIYSHM